MNSQLETSTCPPRGKNTVSLLLAWALLFAAGAVSATEGDTIQAFQKLKVSQLTLAPDLGERTLFALGDESAVLAINDDMIMDAFNGEVLGKAPLGKWSEVIVTGPRTLLLTGEGRAACVSWKVPHVDCTIVLPTGLTRVFAADGEFYAYGRLEGAGDEVQRYMGDGTFSLILKTSKKITALTPVGGRLFFATGSRIYQQTSGTPPRLLFRSDFVGGIRSLVLEESTDIVIFSTEDSVYALRRGVADVLIQGAGGELELKGGVLRVLSTQRRTVLTIENVPKTLVRQR